MLNVSRKVKTRRTATAEALLSAAPATLDRVRRGDVPKGDALEVARIAGVQAAKETSRIIPYCHPLPIDHVGVVFEIGVSAIRITGTATATSRTGVEMEALTAVSVAALTLYDMLKMFDEGMVIQSVRLLEKRGGKSEFRESFDEAPRAAVLVISDGCAKSQREDRSGKLLQERLEGAGLKVVDYRVLPDEAGPIADALRRYADADRLDLVVTTGGTGLGPRDVTPEAMEGVIERDAPGIAEALRAYGRERTPHAMLSRGRAGLRGSTLIVNMPGSQAAAAEGLDALLSSLLHALAIVRGRGHGGHGGAAEGGPA